MVGVGDSVLRYLNGFGGQERVLLIVFGVNPLYGLLGATNIDNLHLLYGSDFLVLTE